MQTVDIELSDIAAGGRCSAVQIDINIDIDIGLRCISRYRITTQIYSLPIDIDAGVHTADRYRRRWTMPPCPAVEIDISIDIDIG